MGNQVGTAFADHPAFGDFPKTESISPLWFRIIKKGMALPINPKLGKVEYLSVGEGEDEILFLHYPNRRMITGLTLS